MDTIEDLYELSSLQSGMLFHTLYSPDTAAYLNQWSFVLRGSLTVSAFVGAWQTLVQRHAILRTGFYWEAAEKPLQVVHAAAKLPVCIEDWSGVGVETQSQRLEDFLVADRAAEFDLTTPPLMRLALLKLSPDVHRMVLTFHHILVDGWSLATLFQELFALYGASREGRTLTLPEVRPYRDYILWWQAQEPAVAEHFWRDTLAGIDAPPRLPRRLAPIQAEPNTGRYEFRLPETTTAALQQQLRRHALTLNSAAQGVWAALLHRYSGEREVLYGATVSGRPPLLEGVEQMVGLFINTLPVRTSIPSTGTVLSFLQTLQSRQLAACQFEYSALTDIQGWSDIPRDQALFESILVFENYPMSTVGTLPGGLRVESPLMDERTHYPVTVTVVPDRDLWWEIAYDPALFDDTLIEQMAADAQRLLEAIAQDPTRAMRDWFPTSTRAFPIDATVAASETLVGLWEAAVARFADHVAIRLPEGETLTYREMDRRANQLAHTLRERGIGRGAVVGVCLERTPLIGVALWGILKAGAAYVPLDPAYPSSRVAALLQDAEARVVLTQQRIAAQWEDLDTPLLVVDDKDAGLSPNTTTPTWEIVPDDTAYSIYTSGSTGTPKGVLIPHSAVANHVRAIVDTYALTPADRVLQFASLSFDVAAEELYPTWLAGGTVVLQPDAIAPTFARLHALCEQEELTVLNLPATYWHEWVAELSRSHTPVPDSLRVMVVGNEAVAVERWAHWHQIAGEGRRFFNAYGVTEAAITTTLYEPHPHHLPHGVLALPIGSPLANLTCYVLDATLIPVPQGVVGELFIGGAGVGHGYWRRPALTAEKFVPDPFSGSAGARLFRTGDMVRAAPDGTLLFAGRRDEQVKVRGFRVELGEVESALLRYPTVREAAASIHTDPHGIAQLVGYVMWAHDSGTIDDLQRALQTSLPAYMVPSAWVVLDDALPLLPSGKVNRRALPAPQASTDTPLFVPPRTPEEQLLAGLWARVLNVPQVGLTDNFFALGGHSLLATQLVARIRSVFEVELPLPTLFTHPTMAALLPEIDALRGQGVIPTVPLVPLVPDQPRVLSFAQQRLWFLAQLEGGTSAYHIAGAIRLTGALDRTAFHAALTDIQQRHEPLRTLFPAVQGIPTLQVLHDTTFPLAYVEGEMVGNLSAWLQAHIEQPFALASEVPVRGVLLRVHENEHIFLLVVHHIVADGWSLAVFTRELTALYQAYHAGETSPLPDLPIQYSDYAYWQRETLQGDTLNRLTDFWKNTLADAPTVLDLPTDHLRGAVQTFVGNSIPFELSDDITRGLHAFSQEVGATLFMTLLAAFQTVLHRYTRQSDIVVGSPVANRTPPDTEELIGLFLNTLVFRTTFTSEMTFRELVEAVRATTLSAYQHQALPFEKVVEAVDPVRSLAYSPLFQAMFSLQNSPLDRVQLNDLTISAVDLPRTAVQTDIAVGMVELNGTLIGDIEYNVDLFEPTTITQLTTHFQHLIAAVLADPDQPLRDISLLTEEETARLDGWNQTYVAYDTTPVDALIEAQARRTPTAIAVEGAGQQLNYADLDRRATQWAHHLIAAGVKPHDRVAVCMERTPSLVVALLAVLKTGAAYVPLDPAYPAERLTYMAEDAGVSLLLADTAITLNFGAVLRVDWQSEQATVEALPATPLDITVGEESLAYVIYTSGSTGQPKGVSIPHRALTNFLLSMQAHPGMGADDTLLAVTSLSFDIAGLELYLPLMSGGRVVLATRDEAGDGHTLQHLLAQGVTMLQATPATWRLLLDAGWQGAPSLTMLVGGEAVSPALVGELLEKGAALWNMYGPTETTIWSGVQRLTDAAQVVVGPPIANTQFYVVDEAMNRVPPGVPGELLIGGDGVAKGYWNRPDLTAERFIANPFSIAVPPLSKMERGQGGEVGARLYRTGDLVRYRQDGTLNFLGRLDHQVKVRGFRIELGEIEATLERHTDVRQAVVIVQELAGDKALVAYLVLSDEHAPSSTEWRQYLRQHLPDYMMPAQYMVVPALPLTPNGKINRRALTSLPLSSLPVREEEAPRTSTEATLVRMWAEVLGLDTVSIYANFFELGGHSLRATQIVSRIEAEYGIALPLRTLFESPTIVALAAVIDAQDMAAADDDLLRQLLADLDLDSYDTSRQETP